MSVVTGENAQTAARTAPAAHVQISLTPPVTGPVPQRPLYAIETGSVAEPDRSFARLCYRVFEWFLGAVALVVTSPIMALQAIIIRLDSPGPALFFQRRHARSRIMRGSELVGRTDIVSPSGFFEPDRLYYVPTTFTFVKFRTMYHDAQQRFPERYRYEFDSHEAFLATYSKVEDDPRITHAGRWLRRLTVDEFPNFWHVVTGEVALVGPRPENPVYLPYYSPDEMRKFTVRPGITGLAQINGRGNLNIAQTLYWDLKYVAERSVWLDLKIIALTLWLVLTRRGAF